MRLAGGVRWDSQMLHVSINQSTSKRKPKVAMYKSDGVHGRVDAEDEEVESMEQQRVKLRQVCQAASPMMPSSTNRSRFPHALLFLSL